MEKLNRRKLYELIIKNNLQRLSDETLEKIVSEIENEIDKSIAKEMERYENGNT